MSTNSGLTLYVVTLYVCFHNISQEMFSGDERSKSALVPRRRIELVVKNGGRVG